MVSSKLNLVKLNHDNQDDRGRNRPETDGQKSGTEIYVNFRDCRVGNRGNRRGLHSISRARKSRVWLRAGRTRQSFAHFHLNFANYDCRRRFRLQRSQRQLRCGARFRHSLAPLAGFVSFSGRCCHLFRRHRFRALAHFCLY